MARESQKLKRARWSMAMLLAAAGSIAGVGAALAIPTNPDPCHTAVCTPWANVAINLLVPASDGHQHRNTMNLWNVAGQYKTYAVWDDRSYRYNAAMDRPLFKPGDNQDFGHGFINVPPRYAFDNNAGTDVPLWARPLIAQVIDQWAATVNELGANSNGVPTETKTQFQQIAQAGEILIRFTNSFQVPAAGGGMTDWPFPYDSEIDDNGNIPNPPVPGGGSPQGGRNGILAFWTPATRVLTFNRNIMNWYQDTGNPAVDNNPANGPNQFDFYTTALHEWGHVLGLDHPMNPAAGTTMQPTQGKRKVAMSGIIRNLDPGSVNGAKNLYTIVRCPPAMMPPGPAPAACPECTPAPR